jgi:hypothetical protein
MSGGIPANTFPAPHRARDGRPSSRRALRRSNPAVVPAFVVALCLLLAAPAALAQTDPLPVSPPAPTMNATMNGAPPAEPLSGWASRLWTDEAGLASADTATQAPPTEKPRAHVGVRSLLRGILSDFTHLPAKQNLAPLIIGGAAALAVYPADRSINAHLAGKGWVHDAFYPGKVLGYGPFDVAAALATYIVGRGIHNNKVAHIGVDLLRAQTVNIVVTYAIKE